MIFLSLWCNNCRLFEVNLQENHQIMNIFKVIPILLCFFSVTVSAQKPEVIEVVKEGDSASQMFVKTDNLFTGRWDTLAQPNFWKEVMSTHQDSCIINIAATRTILGKESFIKWKAQTEAQKQVYKDSVRKTHNLSGDTKIYVTSGKSHFYQIEKVMPSISRAIDVFEENDTDPWFAQAILLIESPGKIAYSNVGAYGPFQLMKSVARSHGLTVNKYVDERKDFDKSAKGAASLIRKTCIPQAKRILDKNNLTYNETDLWFRLFVLHIYHAGAGNVDGLLTSISPETGGQELITTMWQSEWGGFKNASQNYSQVALASLLQLQDLIYQNCDNIFECMANDMN